MATSKMSDDVFVKKLVAEHEPDEAIDYNAKLLLRLVEDILHSTSSCEHDSRLTCTSLRDDRDEDKILQSSYNDVLDMLSFKINRISCEFSYKALSRATAHSTAVSIFEMVRNYKWDVKLVLALAAFSLTYGEFWLLARIHKTNQLAKPMAILKHLPDILKDAGPTKSFFEDLNSLFGVILNVIRCVIEFNDLPLSYITPDLAAYSTASSYIPIASYWTIRGIVFSTTTITSLGHQSTSSPSERWELGALARKLENAVDHLRKQLDSCYSHIEKKMDDEAYRILVELFKMSHPDNMNILRALMHAKDDILPLVDGVTKKRVSLDVLRRRNVLLLISSLDFSYEELWFLDQIYNESSGHASKLDIRYEMVWLPIVEQKSGWNENMQRQFESLQSTMSWYSICHPSLVPKALIGFLQKEWKYKTKPILVVLDPQGRVLCHNALHMMWIWGTYAFPFTSAREEALWREETWGLDLLVDGIDTEILNWIQEDKYVILYGNIDVDWVRKFLKEARRVGVAAQVPLEMVYVGKGNSIDQVRRVLDTIVLEKLPTHYWLDQGMIWFFWARLESMLFSKFQLQQADDHDIVMQEIQKVLCYDKHDGWFILAKGSSILVNGLANTGLQTLMEYDMWKEQADRGGYGLAFEQHYRKLHTVVAAPCCRFEFSEAMGRIPDKLRCPECQRQMSILTTFQCRHDDNVDDPMSIATFRRPTI